MTQRCCLHYFAIVAARSRSKTSFVGDESVDDQTLASSKCCRESFKVLLCTNAGAKMKKHVLEAVDARQDDMSSFADKVQACGKSSLTNRRTMDSNSWLHCSSKRGNTISSLTQNHAVIYCSIWISTVRKQQVHYVFVIILDRCKECGRALVEESLRYTPCLSSVCTTDL
jgi:hypothetical protein